MSTMIERAERRLAELEDTASHYGRLIESLGDPSEWHYTGEMEDAGEGATKAFDPPRCACGHPIRFIFFIEHPTKGRTQVGSTCVEHFQEVNPELYAELTRAAEMMLERVTAEKQRAREARLSEEVANLEAEYKTKVNQLKNLADQIKAKASPSNRYPLPYPLWYALNRGRIVDLYGPPEYNRKSAYKQFYKKQINLINQLLANPDKFPE